MCAGRTRSGFMSRQSQAQATTAKLGDGCSNMLRRRFVMSPSGRLWVGEDGFTPLVYRPLMWFDAWSIQDLANAAVVASWADLTGNGHTASEATNKPAFIAWSPVSHSPLVRFDGSNDKLQTATISVSSAEWTVFIVLDCLELATDDDGIISYVGAVSDDYNKANAWCCEVKSATPSITVQRSYGTNELRMARAVTTGFKILSFAFGGGTGQINLNGSSTPVTDTYDDVAAITVTNLIMGCRWVSSAYGYYGQRDIAELIIYSTKLTPEAISAVELYLSKKHCMPLG